MLAETVPLFLIPEYDRIWKKSFDFPETTWARAFQSSTASFLSDSPTVHWALRGG